MRKPILRNTKTGQALSTKPVGTAAAKQAVRSNVVKPSTAKPATGKPVVSAPAKPSGNVTRTVATIAKQATNFGGLSDRDNAYIAFFAKLAKRATGGKLSVAAIVASGEKPSYAGSAKPHDAGVIVRLTKAGILATEADGTGFTFTKLGTSNAAYAKA